MSITIAGKKVIPADRLFHTTLGWGTVERYDSTGTAIMLIERKSRQPIKLFVSEGGKVNGSKDVYWHEPLKVDLPYEDINFMQKVIDAVSPLVKSIEEETVDEK